MFEEMIKKPVSWLSAEGLNADMVLSSRVRLARNIMGIPFPSIADTDNRGKVLSLVEMGILKGAELKKGNFFLSGEIGELDKSFLLERHLISLEFMREANSGGVFINTNESVSIMINEEDHLRIQALSSGLEIRKTWEWANQTDNELSASLEFDFDSTFGYLTACPTNVGTGMRASILIHLPGLVLTQEIDKVISRITKLGLAVRGFYGEGSDVLGNLFQISNQTTLGRSEEDIIESLERVTQQIIEYEGNARKTLFSEAKEQIEDKIWRAYGILKNARVLTSEEVMNLLSAIRLGWGQGILNFLSLPLINEILILSQPAHLQKYFGKEMNANERDIQRAELARTRLN
jgi:protein arginine kinase